MCPPRRQSRGGIAIKARVGPQTTGQVNFLRKEDVRTLVVAQLVEQPFPMPEVRGSNPVVGRNFIHLLTINYTEKMFESMIIKVSKFGHFRKALATKFPTKVTKNMVTFWLIFKNVSYFLFNKLKWLLLGKFSEKLATFDSIIWSH